MTSSYRWGMAVFVILMGIALWRGVEKYRRGQRTLALTEFADFLAGDWRGTMGSGEKEKKSWGFVGVLRSPKKKDSRRFAVSPCPA
jgi:hypothetical protein